MQCIKKIYRAPNKGRRGVRIIVYGLTTTGLALGATLAYANYDPGFKEDVNKYVPGFAALADFAADRWVDLVDFVNPKQNASVGLKTEKERVKMFESIKPKEDPVKKIEDEETAKQPKAQKQTQRPTSKVCRSLLKRVKQLSTIRVAVEVVVKVTEFQGNKVLRLPPNWSLRRCPSPRRRSRKQPHSPRMSNQ